MNPISELEKDFLPGFKLVQGGSMYHIQDPQGKLVRTNSGSPVSLKLSGALGYHQSRRYRSQLVEQGVIKAPRRRQAKERHTPRKINGTTAHTNPLVVARSVLQSPSSSPKERTMAKEILRLFDQNDKLRELSIRLGRRNQELEGRL